MDGMHDIYRIRGDDAELQRRITKLMDSVACLGADTRTRPGAHEPVSLQRLEKLLKSMSKSLLAVRRTCREQLPINQRD